MKKRNIQHYFFSCSVFLCLIIPSTLLARVVNFATSFAQAPQKVANIKFHTRGICSVNDFPYVSQSLASETAAWEAAGFENVEIENIALEEELKTKRIKTALELYLTAVVFRGTPWTAARIQARLAKASRVFAQCGIKISKVKLVVSNPINNYLDVSFENSSHIQISDKLPTKARPVIFYVGKNLQGASAYAKTESSGKTDSLTNTAWMTSDLTLQEYKQYRDPSYSEEAHELGHILCDCDHYDDGTSNFLSGEVVLANDYIRPDQCELLRGSELLNHSP